MSDVDPCRFNEPGGLTVNELVGMIQDGGESLRFAHAELIRRHFGAYECGLSLGKVEARVAELEKLVEHTMMEVPGYDSDRSVAEQLPLEVMLLRKESEKKLSHTLATCERLSARVAELETALSGRTQYDPADVRVAELQARVAELKGELKGSRAEVERLKEELKQGEAGGREMHRQLLSLHSQLDTRSFMQWRRYPDELPEAESYVVAVATLEAFKDMQQHEVVYCTDLKDGDQWHPLPWLPDERKEGE